MAYHYREPGHSPLVLGEMYAMDLHCYSSKCKLKRMNQATGICAIAYEWGSVVYISATDLSHWHRVSLSNQT